MNSSPTLMQVIGMMAIPTVTGIFALGRLAQRLLETEKKVERFEGMNDTLTEVKTDVKWIKERLK